MTWAGLEAGAVGSHGVSVALAGYLTSENVAIETCPPCGGAVRIIACIEDPVIIAKTLAHLEANATEPEGCRFPPYRAPPQARLFD
jgi:hypothetical protein